MVVVDPQRLRGISAPLVSFGQNLKRAMNQLPFIDVSATGVSATAANMTELPVEDYGVHVARVIDDVAVAGRAAARSSRTFDNFGPGHAKIVLREIILRATKRVRIYAEWLDDEVWEVQWIRDFLARTQTGSVEILVEHDDVFSNPRSALCGAHDLLRNERMLIAIVPSDFRAEHLAIADDWLARVETSSSDRTASVAIGTSELVRAALDLFEVVRARSVPISRELP